jgi:hypothetical protein
MPAIMQRSASHYPRLNLRGWCLTAFSMPRPPTYRRHGFTAEMLAFSSLSIVPPPDCRFAIAHSLAHSSLSLSLVRLILIRYANEVQYYAVSVHGLSHSTVDGVSTT